MVYLRTMIALIVLLTGFFSAATMQAAPDQQNGVLSGLKQVVWQGVVVNYDPGKYRFSTATPYAKARAAAVLEQSPNPCQEQGADCGPEHATFRLYPAGGLNLYAWIAQHGSELFVGLEQGVTDAMIADRQAAKFVAVGDFGSHLFYLVPVGAEILVIDGSFDQQIVELLQFTQTVPQQLAVGQIAMTKPSKALDLWTKAAGGLRVYERPRLYGGTPLTILAMQPKAVFVRTSDGVTGWLHAPANEVLSAQSGASAAQARFLGASYAEIVHPNGIPVRQNSQSSAPRIVNQLKPGYQLMVLGVRGDWLRVYLFGSGQVGWARWQYDGAQYIQVVQ